MHITLHNELSRQNSLLQFYCWLVRGLFTIEDQRAIDVLMKRNIDRLLLMQKKLEWDGRYDLVILQQTESERFIKQAKDKLEYKQISSDKAICQYVNDNPFFMLKGIILNDLKNLLDMDKAFKRGYLLHDIFHGYPEQFYRFQIDCLDYNHSAAYFYNEGYDYYHKRKTIKNYSEIDINSVPWMEQKRIQSSNEVSFRNFREAYINLVFFIESFINSVGFHAYLSGVAKDEKEENQLRGIERISDKGYITYSKLSQRITNISRIVGGSAVDCSSDPFKTYLKTSVELRNQYVHSSVDKPKIQYSLEDWKNKCDGMIDNDCMQVIGSVN